MKILSFCLLFTLSVSAQVKLKDIGVLGLASHDMFAWDSKKEVNTENGRIDLSTIFEWGDGKRWEKGGNPKNAENAPVYTITMRLVDIYKKLLASGLSQDESRKELVRIFHAMVKDSYERMMGMSFPEEGIDEMVTNTEQGSMRALHDILPGVVKLYRSRLFPKKTLKLTNPWMIKAKFQLNARELNQEIPYYDGDYDEEYKNINIIVKRINLKKLDREFIEKFTPYTQEEMLSELAEVGRGERELSDLPFMRHIHELFSKGICPFEKGERNSYMPYLNCF